MKEGIVYLNLGKFGIENGNPTRKPMSSTRKITKDEKGKGVDQYEHRGIIGWLLYLTTSQPDIGVCVKYQADPKEPYK